VVSLCMRDATAKEHYHNHPRPRARGSRQRHRIVTGNRQGEAEERPSEAAREVAAGRTRTAAQGSLREVAEAARHTAQEGICGDLTTGDSPYAFVDGEAAHRRPRSHGVLSCVCLVDVARRLDEAAEVFAREAGGRREEE